MSTPGAEDRHAPRPCAETRLNVPLLPRRTVRSKRTCILALFATEPIWADSTAKRSSGAEPVWQERGPAGVGTVGAGAGAAASRTSRRAVQAILRGTAPETTQGGRSFANSARPV